MKNRIALLLVTLLIGCETNDSLRLKSNMYWTYESFLNAVDNYQMIEPEMAPYIFEFAHDGITEPTPNLPEPKYYIDGLTYKNNKNDLLTNREYYEKIYINDVAYAYIIFRNKTPFDSESLKWESGSGGGYNYHNFIDGLPGYSFYLTDKDEKLIVSVSFSGYFDEIMREKFLDYLTPFIV